MAPDENDDEKVACLVEQGFTPCTFASLLPLSTIMIANAHFCSSPGSECDIVSIERISTINYLAHRQFLFHDDFRWQAATGDSISE